MAADRSQKDNEEDNVDEEVCVTGFDGLLKAAVADRAHLRAKTWVCLTGTDIAVIVTCL